MSSLTTLSARDKVALAQFRRARKTALQFEKRTAKREMEEESKGHSNSSHSYMPASSNAIPPPLLRRSSAIEKAHARIKWLQDHADFLELRCEASSATKQCGTCIISVDLAVVAMGGA